jgi:hypothetical protein
MRALTVDLRRAARAVKLSPPVGASTNFNDSDENEKYDAMPNITGASHFTVLLTQTEIICTQVPTTPSMTGRHRVRAASQPRM